MYDTIIIGAGITGLTAAIYAARKGMKFEIVSSDFGGQFMVSGEVLNYPGIVKTTGVEFRSLMERQMEFNNVKVRKETVKDVRRTGPNFRVITDKNGYDTQTVIIATGSEPRKLNVPGEEEFAKKGVTYCSICDGPLFYDMPVAVVGGGSSALEAIDFMKDIASKIYMLVKGDRFKGHEYLVERIKKNPKVEVIFGAGAKEITGDVLVNGITYEKDGKEQKLDVRGVIIEIGRLPNTEQFKGLVELDDDGHVKIGARCRTSVPGVFAAGDCASGHEYQYVISAGQGCMALLKAARYLANKKD
jgi:thioredoxin-disulfide reductase